MKTRATSTRSDRAAGYQAALADIDQHDLTTAEFIADQNRPHVTDWWLGYTAALEDHTTDDDVDEPFWPDHDHREDR